MRAIRQGVHMGDSHQLRVLPKTDYDLTGLGASGVARVTVAQGIDVTVGREVDFIVRLHAASYASGALIQVMAFTDAPTPEDPAVNFRGGAAVMATFTGGQNVAPALAAPQQVTVPFGGFLGVWLVFTQGANGNVTLTCSLSIDLVIKA